MLNLSENMNVKYRYKSINAYYTFKDICIYRFGLSCREVEAVDMALNHGYRSILILAHWRKNCYPEDCIMLRKVY